MTLRLSQLLMQLSSSVTNIGGLLRSLSFFLRSSRFAGADHSSDRIKRSRVIWGLWPEPGTRGQKCLRSAVEGSSQYSCRIDGRGSPPGLAFNPELALLSFIPTVPQGGTPDLLPHPVNTTCHNTPIPNHKSQIPNHN